MENCSKFMRVRPNVVYKLNTEQLVESKHEMKRKSNKLLMYLRVPTFWVHYIVLGIILIALQRHRKCCADIETT